MKAEEFKEKVKEILNSEIAFDGRLEKAIGNISDDKQEVILRWIKDCKEGITKPEPCKRHKNLIAFVYKSNDNRVRGILTKEKNAYFIELFLDKHYDRKRKYLGL